MKVFSVWDCKAEAYLQPFFSHNKGTAIRSFAQAAQEEGSPFHQHAQDYTLFQIGTWDERTGVIDSETKTALGTALEYCNAITNNVQPIKKEA